jgi:predicted transposase/invertase (TIGR01784 family)
LIGLSKGFCDKRLIFSILEGFISELLHQDIIIINIPESEANKHEDDDKINKVDILCESQNKELILIELQYNSENDYFHRMLFGTSKLISDNMYEGYSYGEVKKIISINIVYFDLGSGDDYVYYGKNSFHGIHIGDELHLSANQEKLYSKKLPSDIFPEYYIIKVNKFNDIAIDSLDEWIYYLKKQCTTRKVCCQRSR